MRVSNASTAIDNHEQSDIVLDQHMIYDGFYMQRAEIKIQ